jgi:hypothetical protein
MRISGLFVSILLVSATPLAAQSLVTLAPPPAPIYGPRTVIPAHVACTDVPVAAHQPAPLHIVAPHGADNREFMSRDAVVVLNGGTPQGLMPGQRFFARRLLGPRAGEEIAGNVATGKIIGAVHTSGWLTVIAADENSALARVDYACDAVMSGDYLDPYVEPTLPAVAPAGNRTDFTNMGRVLQGSDRNESFGGGDFVSIDRGESQGITAGTRIAFYHDRMNGTPLVEVGTGIVLETTASTAKVVMDNARFVIRSGDYWGIRQP